MNKHIDNKKKQINSVKELLKNAKISSENYDSTMEPFFNKDIEMKEFTEDFKDIPEIPESLNRHIILLYQIIGNPDIELYIGNYVIMSLNKCIERYNELCNNNQELVFDFAYRYMGLGHIEVLSCDLTNHLLFKRDDGGANGWEREANYNELLNYKPGDKKYLYFTQWKKEIIH
tara:strand:+ start:183 stop:704 length:522 start_codon:yes stop_codon:yes gene_type:complete